MSKIIFIDSKKEPEKYNIFQQLTTDGKAIIENTDDENKWWRSVSKQIGRDANNIRVNGVKAILPPSSNRYQNVGYVITNKGIVVKEQEKGKFLIDFKF